MEKIAFFGKGGSGKSTVATCVSSAFAEKGLRVLHVGCDPKRDSSLRLLGERPRVTMMDELMRVNDPGSLAAEKFLMRGRAGIDCAESGGPDPGVGCAGRGIILMMEAFERAGVFSDGRYDAAVFDILGDLVCGGFAAPLRHGFAEKIAILVSDEFMSLHAANNIAKMVPVYAANGVALCGLVANLKHKSAAGARIVERFAERIGAGVLDCFNIDPLVIRAERENKTVIEYAPDAPISMQMRALAEKLLDMDVSRTPAPTPLTDEQMDDFLKSTL